MKVKNIINFNRKHATIRKILSKLGEELKKGERFKVYTIGHAHIDTEWLWVLDETVKVCKDTFSKVVNLMKRYDNITFTQSSSFFYEVIEALSPKLFKEISKFISSGRWEYTGGYIEFDANIPSGESIVRHLTMGQRYYKEKFGKYADVVWLPDSFGFPVSLPQILKKSGFKYFATYKLVWNDTNEFPYHIFKWRYYDGSEILALNIPGNYSDILSSFKRILLNIHTQYSKQEIPYIAQIFGRGDHGGGPEEFEIKNLNLWRKKYRKMIEIKHSSLCDYFKDVEKYFFKNLPVYEEELYLEFHRGVYTTGALIKKLNRINENLLLTAEKLYSILHFFYNLEYPMKKLDKLWKTFLLNQTHDAICATVSKEVYEEITSREIILSYKLNSLIEDGLKKLAEKVDARYLVFNPNNWDVDTYIRTKGEVKGYHQKLENGDKLVYLNELPAMGYKAKNSFNDKPNDRVQVEEDETEYTIENKYLSIKISRDKGWIISIFDKNKKREVLAKPIKLRIYYDYPKSKRGKVVTAGLFDAWELYHLDGINRIFHRDLKTSRIRIGEKGPLFASIVIEYKYKQFLSGTSHFKIEIGLYAGKPFAEISIDASWKAKHRLLKLLISPDINTLAASFEIPYGVIKRYDSTKSKITHRAKYEVPGQKWVDISDGNYGVAIITDSKYGYSWSNGILGVSLLRSPFYPVKEFYEEFIEDSKKSQEKFLDYWFQRLEGLPKLLINSFLALKLLMKYLLNPQKMQIMDRGKHSMKIWVYPHRGDYAVGRVSYVAEELNTPSLMIINSGKKESLSRYMQFLSSENIQLITVKLSDEHYKSLIMRLYNPTSGIERVRVKTFFEIEDVREVDLLENDLGRITTQKNMLVTSLRPYEIKTLLLKLKS